jgi:hypothetical protein
LPSTGWAGVVDVTEEAGYGWRYSARRRALERDGRCRCSVPAGALRGRGPTAVAGPAVPEPPVPARTGGRATEHADRDRAPELSRSICCCRTRQRSRGCRASRAGGWTTSIAPSTSASIPGRRP